MSIVQVAKAAGVTHGTVSRVINGRGGVAEATAARVREAMERLGYRPKPPGQRRGKRARPAGLRAGTACLMLVGAPRSVLDRPGVTTLVAALEAELRRHGLGLLLAQCTTLADLPPCVAQQKADGLLVIGEAADRLPAAYRHLPVVWLLSSHSQPHGWADHVLPDNEQIGLLAAEYLAGRGHRSVAFYNEQPEHPGFAIRGETFCAAARQRGLECRALVSQELRLSAGRQALWGLGRGDAADALVEQLLAVPPVPQGLFVPTDEQAQRLYPLLARRSILPGRDVDVVSCDNQDAWLRQLEPRPASVDLNFELMGCRAVEQLLRRIAEPRQPPGTRILIPPRLVDPSTSDHAI